MKRLFLLLCLGLSFSCDDGDLQIETIDFDTASIEFCESSVDTNTTLFFKLNTTEALILDLQSGVLKNEASDQTISSTVPGQSSVTYRAFTDNVNSNYFCDDIPPSTPTVLQEIIAQDGAVLINTVRSESDTTIFEHTIELSQISFVNEQGERITNLSITDFGTVTTQLEEN